MDPNQENDQQRQTREIIEEGEQQSAEATAEDSSQKGGGVASGVAAGIASKTAAGRVLSGVFGWGKAHKKGVVSGGGILSAIISIVLLFSSFVPPTYLMQLANIFNDSISGPGNRNIARRADGLKRAYLQSVEVQNRSELGRKVGSAAQDTTRAARIADTDTRMVARYNQRGPYRAAIGDRINSIRARTGKPPHNWRFFSGNPPGTPGVVSPWRRLKGLYRTPAPTSITGRPDLTNAIEQAGSENITPSERNSILRRTVRLAGISTVALGSTVVCLSAFVDDLIPSDEELYEMFLSYGAEFDTAASHLSTGEDIHKDELGEVMDVYFDTIEVEYDDTGPDQVVLYDGDAHDLDEDGNPVDGDGNPVNTESATWSGADSNGQIARNSGTIHRDPSESAALKWALNEPITGDEEDADLSFSSDAFIELGSVGAISRHVGGFANTMFFGNASLVCLGAGVVALPALAGEIWLNFKSGARVRAITKFLFHGSMTAASIYFMNVLASGDLHPDGPVMQVGMSALGKLIGQSEVDRLQGLPPISTAQASALRNDHLRQLALEDREHGFAWRYLSLQNHRSLASRIAMTQPSRGFSNLLGSFASLPSSIIKSMAGIFTSTAKAEYEFDYFGIQQYGWVEEDLIRVFGTPNLEDIDGLENAEYVEMALRCADGNPNTGDNCGGAITEEGRHMQEVLEECIQGPEYWEIKDEKLCTNPGSTHRDAWVRVGMWVYDDNIVDILECLSHNQPCGPDSTGREPTGELIYPPEYGRNGCPIPYYKMPEPEDGQYTFRSIEARRCGHEELIGVLYTAAQLYYDQHGPESRLDIGDLNAAGHSSHRWGIAADINAKGSVAAARSSDPNYSTEATVDLGKILADTGLIKNIWWCEPGDNSTAAIRDYAQEIGNPINIKCIAGHENHFHIDLNIPRGPDHTP